MKNFERLLFSISDIKIFTLLVNSNFLRCYRLMVQRGERVRIFGKKERSNSIQGIEKRKGTSYDDMKIFDQELIVQLCTFVIRRLFIQYFNLEIITYLRMYYHPSLLMGLHSKKYCFYTFVLNMIPKYVELVNI